MLFYAKSVSFFIFSLIFATQSFAAIFPHGCELKGFGYQENNLILNERPEQSFYLLQNRSTHSIELEHHDIKNTFMSPKLHAKLDPLQWAAFASDIEDLQFKCSMNDADQIINLNCSEVLEVCQYPRAKFALSNKGN